MTSLYEVQDDQVTVQTEDSSLGLRHASVNGRVLSGLTPEGEQAEVDLSHAHVQVKRLNVATTAALVTSVTLLTLAAVVTPFLIALVATRIPVEDGGFSGGSSSGSGGTH